MQQYEEYGLPEISRDIAKIQTADLEQFIPYQWIHNKVGEDKYECTLNVDISPMKLVANIMKQQPESQIHNLQPGILHMFSSCQTIDYKLIAAKPVDVDDDLGRIIIKCISAFQVIDGPLGRVIGVEHKIELTSDKPIKMKSYRYSPEDCDFLKSQVDTMLSQGLIKRADSPYSAPVMVVRQPFRESQPRRLVI